tara:strand:- start:16878 stop:18620 length:1743 start_codon:yes stop_codon:yes gene_type:complete
MPALWPQFIANVSNNIMGQGYKDPGSIPPRDNIDSKNLNFQTPVYIPLVTPSGRRDFGEMVANEYIAAVKSMAMTHVGAVHTNNPAAEQILIKGYGEAFERLYRHHDLDLQDTKDKDGNIVKMGKESHPSYADFCPDPIEAPDPIEEQKKQDKKFDAFVHEKKSDTYWDLYKFRFFQFPCLTGEETQDELEKIFASRLLQQFENITNKNTKWEFYMWVACLGSQNYSNSSGFGGNWSGLPWPNINDKARSDISSAGYNWQHLADNVSTLCVDAIHEVHPEEEENTWNFFNTAHLRKRIQKDPTGSITLPHELDCPLNQWKIQVAYDFEHDPPEYPSGKPKILTSNVIAMFSWYPGLKSGNFSANSEGVITNAPKFTKSKNWVKSKFENTEWKDNWRKVPESKLRQAGNSQNPQESLLEINPKSGGTIFKFQMWQALKEKEAADLCDEKEPDADLPFSFAEGDPYLEMGAITISYWYACLVKPFAPTTSAPPALIPPPLTGIYIPIYYGSAKRLGNNLRKAWNTGKSFSILPAPQPPALAVATAVAACYALHLLEFKLLYLGGIPTPVGPVPMVGFVPVVF